VYRAFSGFLLHLYSGIQDTKKDGLPVPTLSFLLLIPASVHMFSTGMAELCFDYAMGLLWMSGVYYGCQEFIIALQLLV
jgi:hypothetical protein